MSIYRNNRNQVARRLLLSVAAAALTLTLGCRVESHKSGDDANVKIATPFGGLSVKSNEADVQSNVGLSVYPGATLVHKDSNSGAADVNMSFGSFHLGLKALSYRSVDAPDQVLAFYRKDMSRYGSVILCKDHHAVGKPDRTSDGLGCDNESQTGVHTDEEGSVGELKAGSRQHQHIVAVDREGGGTKFGLVALDLPGHLGNRDSEDSKQ